MAARGFPAPASEIAKVLSILQLPARRLERSGLNVGGGPRPIECGAEESKDDDEALDSSALDSSAPAAPDDAVVAALRARGVALPARTAHEFLARVKVPPKRFVKLGLVADLPAARRAYAESGAYAFARKMCAGGPGGRGGLPAKIRFVRRENARLGRGAASRCDDCGGLKPVPTPPDEPRAAEADLAAREARAEETFLAKEDERLHAKAREKVLAKEQEKLAEEAAKKAAKEQEKLAREAAKQAAKEQEKIAKEAAKQVAKEQEKVAKEAAKTKALEDARRLGEQLAEQEEARAAAKALKADEKRAKQQGKAAKKAAKEERKRVDDAPASFDDDDRGGWTCYRDQPPMGWNYGPPGWGPPPPTYWNYGPPPAWERGPPRGWHDADY